MIQRTRSKILISTQHDARHDLPFAQAKGQGLAALLLRTIKDLPIGQKSRVVDRDVRLRRRVAPVWKSQIYGALTSTPSTRRLLDGVVMPVPHRSTEPARGTRRTG